jgi:endonuclease/exonuclease/phosphatase family metal-dependent hydrolase
MLRRSASLLALAGALLLCTAGTASADTTVRFMHFNMCGAIVAAPCNGGEELPVANSIKSMIEVNQPHAVSLNEACQSQWATAYWNLNAAGAWTMHSHFNSTRYLGEPTASSSSTCKLYEGARRFGNAIFSRQTILMAPSSTSLPKTQDTPETRKLWCAVADLYRDTVYCTVHITPYDADIDAQISRVASTVNQWVDSGTPVVLMGDFNVTPTDDRLDRIYHSALGGGGYGRFEEVDQYHVSSTSRCRCGESTHGSSKIDYIFVSARDFYSQSGDATSSSYSDHDPLYGSAILDYTP